MDKMEKVDANTPATCVERYLMFQSTRDWAQALALLDCAYLEQKYGAIQAVCTEEVARRYGYEDEVSAQSANLREFVQRMLESSERDAEGGNPSCSALPQNADCYLNHEGDDVIVTLSTSFSCTRTRYKTACTATGQRLIVATEVEHRSACFEE